MLLRCSQFSGGGGGGGVGCKLLKSQKAGICKRVYMDYVHDTRVKLVYSFNKYRVFLKINYSIQLRSVCIESINNTSMEFYMGKCYIWTVISAFGIILALGTELTIRSELTQSTHN